MSGRILLGDYYFPESAIGKIFDSSENPECDEDFYRVTICEPKEDGKIKIYEVKVSKKQDYRSYASISAFLRERSFLRDK